MAAGGLSDEVLLQRHGGLYSAVVVAELAEARNNSSGENEGAGEARAGPFTRDGRKNAPRAA